MAVVAAALPVAIPSPAWSCSAGSSAETIAELLRVLFPDARSALDATYGSGLFWSKRHPVDVAVTAMDRNPRRARDLRADFTRLPFAAGAFDVVVLDPPYRCSPGRNRSPINERFGVYKTVAEMTSTVSAGASEAWRVGRLGTIVKVQDHIHGSRILWMTRIVEAAIGTEPYDVKHVLSPSKAVDEKWENQYSLWRNHTTYLVFRHDGPVHRARRRRDRLPGGRP